MKIDEKREQEDECNDKIESFNMMPYLSLLSVEVVIGPSENMREREREREREKENTASV